MFFSCGRYQMRDGLKSAFPSGVFGKKAGRSVRSGGPCVPAFERGRRRAGRRGERRTWASGEILRAVGKAYAGSCGTGALPRTGAERPAVHPFPLTGAGSCAENAGAPGNRGAPGLFRMVGPLRRGAGLRASARPFWGTKKSRSLRNRPVQAYASPESAESLASSPSPSPR